jgi:hypothetical protein
MNTSICKNVVTYYVPVPGLWSDESQRALIAKWKLSWEKYGWTATVLSEADVRTHPRFDFFNDHFRAKPTEYGVEYTTASFMRWLAAAHYSNLRDGYIMLTDYDVMNHGLEPIEPDPLHRKIFCDEPPSSIFMGVVAGTAQNFLDMAELFAAWKPDELDYNHHAKCYHQDDLSMLVRMFESRTRPKPDWLIKVPGCALFDYSSWRTSKLVHYGYAMKQAGYWPKADYVGNIRAF